MLVVVCDPVVQHDAILMGERQLTALQHRQRGEVLRMDVQDASGLRVHLVKAGVNMEGNLPELAFALENIAPKIAQNELTCGHLAEMQATRIDEEQCLAARQHHAVVVSDLLIHSLPGENSEDGCKITPELPFSFGRQGHINWHFETCSIYQRRHPAYRENGTNVKGKFHIGPCMRGIGIATSHNSGRAL